MRLIRVIYVAPWFAFLQAGWLLYGKIDGVDRPTWREVWQEPFP